MFYCSVDAETRSIDTTNCMVTDAYGAISGKRRAAAGSNLWIAEPNPWPKQRSEQLGSDVELRPSNYVGFLRAKRGLVLTIALASEFPIHTHNSFS